MRQPEVNPADHPNAAILRELYATGFAALWRYVTEDVVLHAAERDIPGMRQTHAGAEAVQVHENRLVRRSAGTFRMDVHIAVANDYFGAVMGVLSEHVPGAGVAMPFCGLWRFRDGRIVEHWEQAYDALALPSLLTESATG